MSGVQRGMGAWGFLRPMSHDMQRAFYASNLPPTARFVSVTLAWHHNGKTGQCDPSIALLCEETGLSERAVRLSLRTIEAAGYMTTTPRRGTTPLYILTPPALDAPRQQMPPGTTCPPPLPLDAPPPRHQMPLPPARRAPKLEGTGIRTGNEPESFASASANAGNTDSLFPIEPPPPKPKREPKPKPETTADPRKAHIMAKLKAVYLDAMGADLAMEPSGYARTQKELDKLLPLIPNADKDEILNQWHAALSAARHDKYASAKMHESALPFLYFSPSRFSVINSLVTSSIARSNP
jgi:hypothetical protein